MPRTTAHIIGWLAALAVFSAGAAPKAELWARWAVHNDANAATIDHADWDRWLKRYVVSDARDNIHRVRYAQVDDAGRDALNRYLMRLQTAQISRYARSEQKPYWINLYNAATLKVVLDHYPVKSITEINISPGLLAKGPWGKKWLMVESESLSLDDIEHRILRPVWKDPLLHYGVNCASIGCPNLATEAYTASNTDRLLRDGARSFINSARGVSLQNGRLTVSSIYQWFKPDFGGSDAAVIAHLKNWAAPELQQSLSTTGKINGDAYDWSLNESR